VRHVKPLKDEKGTSGSEFHMDTTEKLLKELTEAHGIPGYEAPIRAVVIKQLESDL